MYKTAEVVYKLRFVDLLLKVLCTELTHLKQSSKVHSTPEVELRANTSEYSPLFNFHQTLILKFEFVKSKSAESVGFISNSASPSFK